MPRSSTYGKPTQKAIGQAHPDEMEKLGFAAGSMGPKVQAACEFARHTGKVAVIGSLSDIEAIVQGKAGTRISTANTWHYLLIRRDVYGTV